MQISIFHKKNNLSGNRSKIKHIYFCCDLYPFFLFTTLIPLKKKFSQKKIEKINTIRNEEYAHSKKKHEIIDF